MQEPITSSLVLAFLVGCRTGDVVTDLGTPVTAQILHRPPRFFLAT